MGLRFLTLCVMPCSNGLQRGSWKEVILPLLPLCLSMVLKEGLEMSLFWSFCCLCACCHRWLSWKELDLLCIWVVLLFACLDWDLGSWNEHGLVLLLSYWPVTDWGLERGSWNDSFCSFFLSWAQNCSCLLVVSYHQCIWPGTSYWFWQFQYWTQFLHSFCKVPVWDLAWHSLGVQWWSLSESGVSTTKNWWSWNEFFA